VRATAPRWMRLEAEFSVRGGLYTTVIAEHRKPGWAPAEPVPRPEPPAESTPPAPEPDRIMVAGTAATVTAAEPTPPAAAVPTEPAREGESNRFRMLPRARPRSPAARVLAKTARAVASPVPPPAPPAERPRRERRPESGAPAFVGIDIGSSHCEAVAIDAAGMVLARASAPIPLAERRGSEVEQDPQVWWDALTPVLQTLFRTVAPGRVRKLAVDGTSGTILLADAEGIPIGRALMYSDARAIEQAAQVAAHASADCGAHGPSSALAKLLWLREQHPDRDDLRVLQQADWIAGRLTGDFGHSDYNNCLKLGFDAVALGWPDWFATLGVPRAWLPAVHAPGETVGTVSAEIAREFGLSAGTEVVAGTTDGVASFLAAGIHQPGQAVTALGSPLVLKLLSDAPVYSAKHGVYSHRLGRLWLAGGASNSGGAVLLQYFKPEQMQEMSGLIDPEQPTGLEYYPLAAVGERFPINDPDFSPMLEPLPGDSVTFFQGLLEGIARIEQMGYEVLQNLGAPTLREVYTTGGGARNPAWQRLRARMLGVPVRIAGSEQAAYGTALLAAGRVAGEFGLGPALARAENA